MSTIKPVWIRMERIQQLMGDRATRNQTTIEEETAKVVTETSLGRMGTVEE